MKKNKDRYPYLTRQHGESPENWRSKCRSSSRGRPYMNTKPFGIEIPRPTYSAKDKSQLVPTIKGDQREVTQETPAISKGAAKYTGEW